MSFSPSDGTQTSVLYDSSPRVASSISGRRTTDGLELYVSLETADQCQRNIHRIADGKAIDMGIVGYEPTISPDGRLLAYEKPDPSRPSAPGSCPFSNLIVRDLSTGTERKWVPPSGQYVRWLVWTSDSQRVVYQLGAEAWTGSEVLSLDPKTDTGTDLVDASTSFVIGLQPREYAQRPIATSQGVFVAIYCCFEPTTDSTGSRESIQFGLVGPNGQLRRIPVAGIQPLESVTAVDPGADEILLHDSGANVLIRAKLDGTNRTRLNSGYRTVLWM